MAITRMTAGTRGITGIKHPERKMMFDDDKYFAVEGRILNRLMKIAERFNDGTKMDANERRDLAQELRAKLEQACPVE